jgi:hypothetical protein
MTINVAVRVPDGIVVASDSLASSFLQLQPHIQIGTLKCKQCGFDHPPGLITTPPISVPGGSTPLATKLFYVGDYAVTAFGAARINGRSLYNHVMMFVTTKFAPHMTLMDVAEGVSQQLAEAINSDPHTKGAPPGAVVGGFQVCGYDQDDVDMGRIAVVTLRIGRAPEIQLQEPKYGVVVTGNAEITNMLFRVPAGGQSVQPSYDNMTLPDAIDYARFLVQTTSDYHRFANMQPMVGGPTDIALITKWIGFRWVQRKKILDDDTTRLNVGKVAHEISQIRRHLPDMIRQSRNSGDCAGPESTDL